MPIQSPKNRVKLLDFSKRKLKAILPCIGVFLSLECIYLYSNKLTFLTASIDKLIKLRRLSLNDDQVSAMRFIAI